MENIQQMIAYMLVIIPIGGAARIIFCLCGIAVDADAQDSYKRRAKNALYFLVVAECITGLLQVVAGYYGG